MAAMMSGRLSRIIMECRLNSWAIPPFKAWNYGGALERLGIPRDGLIGLLDQLNGLVASADFDVELYSLGKKADVDVKAEIFVFERQRLPGNYFEIPPQYRPAFGKEEAVKTTSPENNVGSKSLEN